MCSLSARCLARGPGVCRLCDRLAATSKRTSKGRLSGPLLPVPLSLQRATATPRETLQQQLAGLLWFSLLWGHCPFPWVLVHAKFCLCPPRVESLFPIVLWKSCNQIPLTFKVRFPVNSQSLCLIPRLGSLTWGSEPSQQWENLFGLLVRQFVGHPPSRYGICFYRDFTPPTISLWFLFVFGHGVSFSGELQHPPVNGCSTASCSFGVLVDENTSFYLAILNQKSRNFSSESFWKDTM